jgi:hypothetical protein
MIAVRCKRIKGLSTSNVQYNQRVNEIVENIGDTKAHRDYAPSPLILRKGSFEQATLTNDRKDSKPNTGSDIILRRK